MKNTKSTRVLLCALALVVMTGTAAQSQESLTPPAQSFWDVLNDTTLHRLMNLALRNNIDLRAADAIVDGASAARRESALNLAPVVTARGGFTRQRFASSQFPTLGSGGFPDQNLWDAGVTTAWELDVFGRLRNTLSARGAMQEAADEGIVDLQVRVAASVANAYFEVRGMQEHLAVARRNAENQRRTFELTQLRLDAGQGNAFDMERARAQLNLTLAAIPRFERGLADAQYRVGVLVGRSPKELSEELVSAGPLPELPNNVTLPDAAEVVGNRPDVVRAQREWAANSAMVRATRADYLPRVSVAGNIGYTANGLNSFGNSGTLGYNFGPVFTWPLFDLGRVKARVDAARARESEAQARYDQVKLLAAEEFESATVRYRTERARLGFLVEAAAASERAAALAMERYQGGIADFFEVLDAERTLLAAQEQLAQVRTDAASAYVALYQAVGARW